MWDPAASNVIDFVTISSTGNASDFGDLTVARGGMGGLSSSTRGLTCRWSADPSTNTIDYITIASTGNAVDFGDLIILQDIIKLVHHQLVG
jgi:hypothetical protein